MDKSASEVTATASADVVDASAETKTQEPSALIKSAADAGAALAQEMMTKIASNMANLTPAQVAGNVLAQTLLETLTKQAAEKKAGVGDENTMNGVTSDGVPTKIERDNASLVGEHDASIKPMPTGDGIRNQGTATDIYNALNADAVSQGGTPTVQTPTGPEVDGSGVKAVPNQVKTASFSAIEKMAAVDALVDEGCSFEEALEHVKAAEAYLLDQHEKAAAVAHLVSEGIDFDEAAELVKQAGVALAQEEESLTKQAALEELIANGVDFDQAIELIKQAGVGDENTMNGVEGTGGVPTKVQRDNASLVAEHDASIGFMPTGDGIRNQGSATDIYNAIMSQMLAQGGTPTVQTPTGPEVDGSGVQAVPNQVKTASLKALIEKGVDFDTASKMVKEAQEKAETQAKQVKAK
jgi:hypothetical protein